MKRLLFGCLEYCICSLGGTELGPILSMALSGVGMIMQQQAADDAAERQQRIINQAAEEEERLNKQKADTIQSFAQKTYDPATRDQRYEDAATKQEQSLVDSLLKANASGEGGEVSNATQGALSSDYERARGAATAAATDDIMKRARLMARQGANSLMYSNEAMKSGQLASDLAGIGYASNRNNRYADQQLNGVRDQGSFAGGLLSGFAKDAGSLANGLLKAKSEWDAGMNTMFGSLD